MASRLTRSDGENSNAEPTDKHRPPQVGPHRLREAVSVRAYYKAAQRGLEPGHEIEDWLEAERELLSVSSFFDEL